MKNRENGLGKIRKAANSGKIAAGSNNDGDRVHDAEPGTERAIYGEPRIAVSPGGLETDEGSSIPAVDTRETDQITSIKKSGNSASTALVSDLSIEEASALIAHNTEFKRLISLSISTARDGEAISKIPGETAEAAVRRMTELFHRKYPLIRLFNYLDLVRVQITAIDYSEELKPSAVKWHFKEICTLTAKGEGLWRGGKVNPLAVPFAARALIAVTELVPESEDMISAKVIWRVVPNELGRLLDSNSEAFAKLPIDLRVRLMESGIAEDLRAAYAKTFGGVADFVRGDSGWQLLDTYLEPLTYA